MVAELNVLNNKEGTHGSGGFSPSGCDPSARCGNGLEKIYPTCAVRYGYMRYIGEFRYSPGMKFNCGGKVVIQTNRGMELGEQVSLTCTGCDRSIGRRQMLDYAKRSGAEFLQLKSGKLLRAATPQDENEQQHLNRSAALTLIQAREMAAEAGHDMKFVACEHLLGGERIVFHFMAEERVDFRDLVRNLAQKHHTRVEMHQVGARDEARLVADYEICGRECCCKNFLKKLHRVSMRMAKLQKATLDPSKVSGRCGRLRCCLRYEHEGYEELHKKLPRVGTVLRTERGLGTVKDRQILTQLLLIEYDDGRPPETIGIEEILEQGTDKPQTTKGTSPTTDEPVGANLEKAGPSAGSDASPPPASGDGNAEGSGKGVELRKAPEDGPPRSTAPPDTNAEANRRAGPERRSEEGRKRRSRRRRRRSQRGRKPDGHEPRGEVKPSGDRSQAKPDREPGTPPEQN